MLTKRGVSVLFMLSIIAPVGAFATLKLTGILRGPITVSEVIDGGALAWAKEEPSMVAEKIGESITHMYSDSEIDIVHVITVDSCFPAFLSSDYHSTGLWVNVTARVARGCVAGARHQFSCANVSTVDVAEEQIDNRWAIADWVSSFSNLSVVQYDSRVLNPPPDDVRFYVDTAGIGNPAQAGFSVGVAWVELAEVTTDRSLEGLCEVTYFNGSIYKKVVFSTVLTWLCDQAGNSLQEAWAIEAGDYEGWVEAHSGDMDDYYEVQLEKGEQITVSLVPASEFAFLDMDIYNGSGGLLLSYDGHHLTEPMPASLECTFQQAGYAYVRVGTRTHFGYYTLSIRKGY